MKRACHLAAWIMCLILLPAYALATTHHVPADFTTIQAGLDVSANGDTVLVQPGTYVENIVWPQVNGIKLIAAGDSSNTIIDGNEAGRVILLLSEGLVDTTTLIRGFTIQNGGHEYWYQNGAGIKCIESSPTISHCRISENRGGEFANGTGLYLDDSSPHIIHCRIADNRSEGAGGGVYIWETSNPTIQNCVFSGNFAVVGGAIYCRDESIQNITDCVFEGNVGELGAAIYGWDSSNLEVSHCTFASNSSSYAAGIYFYGSDLQIVDCTFYYNYGVSIRLEISNAVVMNCTLSDNHRDPIVCTTSNVDFSNCTVSDNQGTGFFFEGGSSTVSSCTISDNTGRYGGGIRFINTQMTMTDCLIIGNSVYGDQNRGGGIYCNGASPDLIDCTISENSSLNGAGICCDDDSSPNIIRCTITNNTSYDVGGGISCLNSSHPTIDHSVVASNTAFLGGGLYTSEGSGPEFAQSTLSGNTGNWYGAGVFCENSDPIFTNTILSSNQGEGIYVEDEMSHPTLHYCTSYGNSAGDFVGDSIDPDLGVLVTTNANGDSCDIYNNIFLDPQYVDPGNGDYHLQPDSPCIDGGDPTSPLDPDSTIADIGAFYFDQNVGVNEGDFATADALPAQWSLLPAHPNPFNAATTITISLPQPAQLNVSVLNIQGQQVATLASSVYPAGVRQFVFDASSQASGVYFVRATVTPGLQDNPGHPTTDQTQKIVLLR